MAPAILTKTPVEAKWNTTKIQEEGVLAFARMFYAANFAFEKHPEVKTQFEQKLHQLKLEHFKKQPIKTPIDLVSVMAEWETNVLGSKIKIVGDEKQATIEYETCACWNAIEKVAGKMSKEQEEKMGEFFTRSLQNLAKDFGFKVETKCEDPTFSATFIK